MIEQSCSGKGSFSQTLGPPLPEKRTPLLPTLRSVPIKTPTLARRSCVRKNHDSTRRNLVSVFVLPRSAIPFGMARRKAKNCAPGAVSTGNTKYSPGAMAIDRGGFMELEVAPLAPTTWYRTKMTSGGFGDVVRQPMQGRAAHSVRWRFPRSRRSAGNLQSLRLIITVWRVKPRRK
jgi:hypothetical protein